MATATKKTDSYTILNPEDPATAKQLLFLASLVRQTDAKVSFPKNRGECSKLIDRLKKRI